MQRRFDEGLELVQVEAGARQLFLVVRQPGLFQHPQHIGGGGRGKTPVHGYAVELEAVGKGVGTFVVRAFLAAGAGAATIAEGVAQVAVEVHHGLEVQAFVDFEQVAGQFGFGTQGYLLTAIGHSARHDTSAQATALGLMMAGSAAQARKPLGGRAFAGVLAYPVRPLIPAPMERLQHADIHRHRNHQCRTAR